MLKKLTLLETEGRKKLGETTTVPYEVYVKQENKSPEERLKELISRKNKRKDGRTFSQHRKIYMKCGVIEDSRGSAYLEMGGTKVIASVTGPVEMPQTLESEEQGFLNCEVKFSQFSCKSREEEEELGTEIEAVTDALHRALEPAIRKDEFSNIQINLAVSVIESDGGVIPCAVNAATLAVANARLPMSDLVASVTLGVRYPPNIRFIDPTLEEEELFLKPLSRGDASSQGLVTLSYMDMATELADCLISGNLDEKSVLDSLKLLKVECSKVYIQMQQILVKDVKQVMDIIIAKQENKDKQEEIMETSTGIHEELRKLSS